MGTQALVVLRSCLCPSFPLNCELLDADCRIGCWKEPSIFVTFRLFREPLALEEVRLVRDHIISGDRRYYELLAVSVLTDHVHLLLRPQVGRSLSRVMKGIKGVTARELNRRRGRKGSIGQDESFDRIVRDEAELLEKLNYMFLNPVKAGLTNDPCSYQGWYLKGERA